MAVNAAPTRNGPKGTYPPSRRVLNIFSAIPTMAPMTDDIKIIGTSAGHPNQAPRAANSLKSP
ncbi:hypothetical protein D3C71_1981370 [compost metagenome]